MRSGVKSKDLGRFTLVGQGAGRDSTAHVLVRQTHQIWNKSEESEQLSALGQRQLAVTPQPTVVDSQAHLTSKEQRKRSERSMRIRSLIFFRFYFVLGKSSSVSTEFESTTGWRRGELMKPMKLQKRYSQLSRCSSKGRWKMSSMSHSAH